MELRGGLFRFGLVKFVVDNPRQFRLNRMPEHWHSVTFFDGDPREGGNEIEPKLSRVVYDEFQQTWSMRKQAGTQKTWLACRYYLSSISLIRPLADEIGRAHV